MGKYRRDYQTDIIIVGWNKCDVTHACIRSVRRHTLAAHYQITYIDNGSDADKLQEYILDPFPEINVVRLPFNHGFVRGANIGLAMSLLTESEYVLLLNNDTFIPSADDTWLERLTQPMLEDSQIGAVGAVTDNVAGYQKRDAAGEGFTYAPSLIGFCMLIRKTALRQVGLLDERFTPGNYDDFDYSIRLHRANWNMAVAESVWIHHAAHTSFKGLNAQENFGALLEHNRKQLTDKWNAADLMRVGL